MSEPFVIHHGDVLDRLREMPSGSVHCVITSPPYWGLRDYGVQGQIGMEPTPGEFIEKMVVVFTEVRRILRDDGTCWLNLGDSYANDSKWGGSTGGKHSSSLHGGSGIGRQKVTTGLKAKDLVGIPWRVALALQADGWYLRSDIIWHKPNPMPESVTDRPTKAHEYLFLLTKSARYFYDADAIKEPSNGWNGSDFTDERDIHLHPNIGRKPRPSAIRGAFKGKTEVMSDTGQNAFRAVTEARNKRTVWTIATQPTPEAHFATFPMELAETCLTAGTSEQGVCSGCGAPVVRVVTKTFTPQQDVSESHGVRGAGDQKPMDASNTWQGVPRGSTQSATVGWQATCRCECATEPATVLDPFSGAATTGLACLKHNRNYIGIELNAEYVELSYRRARKYFPLMMSVCEEPEAYERGAVQVTQLVIGGAN